jgi:hypothetical protein
MKRRIKGGERVKQPKEINIGISRIEKRIFMNLNSEQIEISDYKILSSADGTTELSVKIVGTANVFELSANLSEQMQQSQ